MRKSREILTGLHASNVTCLVCLKPSSHVTVEFYRRALEFYCRVFLLILKKKEFYCRWSSTVAYKEFLKNYLNYCGSIVGGVLLSLEFYGRHTTFNRLFIGRYPLEYLANAGSFQFISRELLGYYASETEFGKQSIRSVQSNVKRSNREGIFRLSVGG
jgi:hypothetical protein